MNRKDRPYLLFESTCTDKKNSSYIRKFRIEQLQSHIWLTDSSYILRIFSYIRKPFLISDIASAPLWISLYMREILFYFLSVWRVRYDMVCVSSMMPCSLHARQSGWPFPYLHHFGGLTSCNEGLSMSITIIKGAQAWDIRDRVIYTELSHLGRWLEEWTKKNFCVKC
jgi:hypothetical protein